MEFDQAMRAANTMAGKGAKDFENLKSRQHSSRAMAKGIWIYFSAWRVASHKA